MPPRLARRRLGVVELALDDVQPAVPEARVGEVDADDRSQLLRAARAAGLQQLACTAGTKSSPCSS